jgi:NAD(P)-dependent dehydrogenase (short-subunit alcohol dehydrogenase family)
MMKNDMQNKNVIVTGASYGIGQACAIALAEDGFDLVISDLNVESLINTQSSIEALGKKVLSISLDIKDQSQIDIALTQVEETFGGFYALVNNAGVPSLRKSAIEIQPHEWQELMAVNLTGTFFMTTSFGKKLIQQGMGGSVVNIGSTHGQVGFKGASAYGIAKAGISHLSKMLAIEWAPFHIRINTIAPGSTMTESRAPSFSDPTRQEELLSRIPMQRFGKPEEIAAAVKYLVSPLAAYTTGQTILIDGGLTAA